MKKHQKVGNKHYCSKCDSLKDINDFYFHNDKIKTPCKECKNKYQKSYYNLNKDKIEQYRKSYYSKNRKRIIANQLIRDNKRKYNIKCYQSVYRKINKTRLVHNKRLYIKNRLRNDPIFKLKRVVSNTIYQSFNKQNLSIANYLPYTISELKLHLEQQFESWMNWNNWGQYNINTWNDNDPSTWKWNIDHIIPQAQLPYSSIEDNNFKKCWALENLRPYSAKQNILDGNRKNISNFI